jgi:hypothetical protein
VKAFTSLKVKRSLVSLKNVFCEVVYSVAKLFTYILAAHSQIPVIGFAIEFAGQEATQRFADRLKRRNVHIWK